MAKLENLITDIDRARARKALQKRFDKSFTPSEARRAKFQPDEETELMYKRRFFVDGHSYELVYGFASKTVTLCVHP